MNSITVGISDLKVGRAEDELVTYALGSCVGICLYEPILKIGGLSHIMLPTSTLTSNAQLTPMRFADTAIEMLLKKLEAMGAPRSRIRAKIAGGAQMFAVSSEMNIGQRNVIAVKAVLHQQGISILAEDTGKDYGRTVRFCPGDGIMHITSANRGKWDW